MNPQEKPLDKKIDNTKELAHALGVSTATIRRLVKNSDVPRLRIGRTLRFDRQSVFTWLSGK